MKIDIYTLLGMIKDGKAPKRIALRNEEYIYMEDARNYQCLTEPYEMMKIYDGWCLNDEVTILETTITYKQDNIENNKQDKIKKLDLDGKIYSVRVTFIDRLIGNKINEIIDKLNGE